MKKVFAIVLCLALLGSMTACNGQERHSAMDTTAPPPPKTEVITDTVRAELDALMEKAKYEGIAYLTHNGKVVYEYASGNNDNGDPLTVQSPMYIASVSKQFCAAAILMLRDQGKLSVDDTLEKYFPEYTIGKTITLKNLLTMRSGIVRDYQQLIDHPDQFANMTDEQINDSMKAWAFDQPLLFEPGTQFAYSNVNYILLSYVVEQASGQRYEEFIRQNIFEPLGMTHSGFIKEVEANPQWGLNTDRIYAASVLGDVTKGCGDIVSTAGDLDIWMTALQSGMVVCEESFREMATDHNAGGHYGYALTGSHRGGWGHGGNNKGYTSRLYFNEKYGYNLFVVTGNTPDFRPDMTEKVFDSFMKTLFAAEDAAA